MGRPMVKNNVIRVPNVESGPGMLSPPFASVKNYIIHCTRFRRICQELKIRQRLLCKPLPKTDIRDGLFCQEKNNTGTQSAPARVILSLSSHEPLDEAEPNITNAGQISNGQQERTGEGGGKAVKVVKAQVDEDVYERIHMCALLSKIVVGAAVG
jgi:hypothetical protein